MAQVSRRGTYKRVANGVIANIARKVNVHRQIMEMFQPFQEGENSNGKNTNYHLAMTNKQFAMERSTMQTKMGKPW